MPTVVDIGSIRGSATRSEDGGKAARDAMDRRGGPADRIICRLSLTPSAAPRAFRLHSATDDRLNGTGLV
jgi:hypothetical protein